MLFDTIGHVGGYAFLHRTAAAHYLPGNLATGVENYPQGGYLAYAVLHRMAGTRPDGVTAMNVMLWLYVATFVFFGFAVLWAVRRVAGPGANARAVAPVLGLVALDLVFGDPVGVFVRGYPNEIMALALVAVLAALLARPLPRTGEQVVTVALLLVGTSFAYHLFLPWAGAAAAVWAWRDRRRLLHHRWALVAAAVLLPAAAVTPLLNLTASGGGLLTSAGTALRTDRPVTLALLALVAAGLLVRRGLRSPARRMVAVEVAAALLTVVALTLFQYATAGHTAYYLEKTIHLLIVVSLVGLGTLARLVPARLLPVGATLAAAGLVLAGAGGPAHTMPGSTGLRFVLGVDKGSPQGARDAVELARRYPDGGGKVNVDLMHTPYANFFGTFFGSAMQRDFRHGADWYPLQHPQQPHTLADLEAMVRDSDVPVRFFVQNPHASFLVLDPDHPDRQRPGPGVDPAAYGDPRALTNVAAVQYLAGKYPDRVEVVFVDES